MQVNNSSSNVFFENRSTVIIVIILAILGIIFFGILYFIKQRDLEGENLGRVTKVNNLPQQEAYSLADLIKFTSAPENNPDIKPNTALTAFTTVPEESVSVKVNSELLDKLTAPTKQ